MEPETKQIRIAIVGPSCVGKTSIVKRFTENSFTGNNYIPTPGIEFGARRMSIKSVGTVTVILLDLSGQTLSSRMLEIYLNSGIDICLLTYDVTNMSSLNELRAWIDAINLKVIGASKDPSQQKVSWSNSTSLGEMSLALVGSKSDLEHLRTVRLDAHSRFAQEFGIKLSFIVSAKNGDSVQTCFTNCTIAHLNPDARTRGLLLPNPSQSTSPIPPPPLPGAIFPPGFVAGHYPGAGDPPLRQIRAHPIMKPLHGASPFTASQRRSGAVNNMTTAAAVVATSGLIPPPGPPASAVCSLQ